MRHTTSATKHGIDPVDAIYVATNPTWVEPLDDQEGHQWRELRLGFDRHARALETVVIVADDGDELLIHAMKLRATYLPLLHRGLT